MFIWEIKKPSLPLLNILLGFSDQQLVMASMAALLDHSCARQHANFRVRRAKSGIRQSHYVLFYPHRIRKQICWLPETNVFQLASLKSIEDSKQPDTSEGTEYIWPCGKSTMRDLRMTHNLKITPHFKRKLKKKKRIFENRKESRYLLNQFKIQASYLSFWDFLHDVLM